LVGGRAVHHGASWTHRGTAGLFVSLGCFSLADDKHSQDQVCKCGLSGTREVPIEVMTSNVSGVVPAYYSLDTRGVVIDGWFGVRGRGGAWEGLRLGEW